MKQMKFLKANHVRLFLSAFILLLVCACAKKQPVVDSVSCRVWQGKVVTCENVSKWCSPKIDFCRKVVN